MGTKRVLNRIRLDKIAAVDKPCQHHATIALIKRAPVTGAPPAIVKKTFDEALRAQLVSEKVGDVFWRAFENQWALKEAFRTALSDEIADGGDGTSATEAFTAAMGQLATAAADAARNAASTAEQDLEAAVEEAVSKWLQRQEHTMPKITTKAQLKTAVATFDMAKSTFGEATAIIGAAVELDAVDELPADSELAKMADDKKKKKGEGYMDPKAVKSLQREVAVLKMDTTAKAYFEGLSETDQDTFLAKSAADQAADVAGANAADPVMHKCLDGTVIRKSDGATVLALAKSNDELRGKLATMGESVTTSTIEKRAAKDFPNVAATEAVDMLKAAEQVGEDSVAGKAIIKTLTTMNSGRAGFFKSLGSTEAPEAGNSDIKKARADYETEVNKMAVAEKIGKAEAMSKVRALNPELFAAAYPETAEADAE